MLHGFGGTARHWDRVAALLDRERDIQAALSMTADHAEGKAAFMAKRTPRFTGR